MGLLAGKHALITGGTTGLGLAIAERFLAEGAQVVITGRDRGLGERAEQALGPGARFAAADAGDPEAVAASVSAAAGQLGGLDVLVNNAGVGVAARLVDTPLADYDRVMNVNVRGYLLYAQHAYPHLARRRGCMIHIASDAGIWGEQATGLYSVTKAAVVMLGKMLALDGGPDGVRSNVLCPGDIWPGMRHMAPPGENDRAESGDGWPVPPIGRVGQAGDVAAAAVFFASDQAEFITGTTLLVDGGMTAGYLQRERGVLPQDWKPDSVQRRNTSIFSSGQAPSHGMVPLRRRSRMPAACACTSAWDHRSKANAIDLRSCSRNSGLMCAAKLTVSSGPGRVTGASSSVVTGAGAGGPAGPQSQAGAGAPLARELHSR
jgi:NAD(P)-dependent dehydrogenase (short-subunit alcohol dehydrogenase family)